MTNPDDGGIDGSDPNDGGVSDVEAVRDHVVAHVTTFVRDLRDAGANVAANAGIEATRALATIGLDDRWRARTALRATLVTRREDLSTFDRLFPPFWSRLMDEIGPAAGTWAADRDEGNDEPAAAQAEAGTDRNGSESDGDHESHEDQSATSPSDAESGAGDDRRTDESPEPAADPTSEEDADASAMAIEGHSTTPRLGFDADDTPDDADRYETAVYSPAGRPERIGITNPDGDDALERAVTDLTPAIAELEGRRWDHTRSGGRLDTRRALRRSFATGGTVLELPDRSRRTTGVRCTLLVDVSRSVLDTIDRGFLVQFLRTAYEAWRTVRIFFFDTDIQEVTDRFAAPSADAAVRALRRAETRWGGGTRIGHAIASVRDTHPRSVDRTTTVLVISDGLEVGETDTLEEGMAWLARRANGVLWLNPLAASPEYEPACRGMALSMPYVDGLFAFTGPKDVAEIARQLRRRGLGGRVGYEHDPRY